MKDISQLRDRFQRDGLDRRLGNIASNLLRLSSWLQMGRDPQATVDLMQETAG